MSADADAQEAHIGRTAIEEMFQLWQVDEERAEWTEGYSIDRGFSFRVKSLWSRAKP